MPMVSFSTYRPPALLRSGHLQTVFATQCRRVPPPAYQRERIDTADGDFLDLDWSRSEGRSLAIISHGLEGSSQRPYVRGMVHSLNRRGWDVLAWNMRGCSGEPNRRRRFYHSGATEDLEAVLRHVEANYSYGRLGLVGFSLGGNLTLKYLGEKGRLVPPALKGAVCFSVPCDLADSATRMARKRNRLYMWRFLRLLGAKIRAKNRRYPGLLDEKGLQGVANFWQFDQRYTASLHGFASAADYYRQASCQRYLAGIQVPALLVNAADDPFLGPRCYPRAVAQTHRYLSLEIPAHGGHVGFVTWNRIGEYWSETRTGEFLLSNC